MAKDGRYKVLKGINYPPPDPKTPTDERAPKIGDVVNDLPADAIKELLRQEAIEPADKDAKLSPVRVHNREPAAD